MTNTRIILVGKSEGKKSYERPYCKWKESNQLYIKKIECETVGWIEILKKRQCCVLADTLIKHVPQMVDNFLKT
jgi:hypothetical protein